MSATHHKGQRRCDVESCDNPAIALGLCQKHDTQMRKGWPLKRRGESIPRGMEQQKPWLYENPAGEAELEAIYGEPNV